MNMDRQNGQDGEWAGLLASRFIFFLGLIALLTATPAFALTGRVINQTFNRPEPHVEVSYIRHATGDVTIVRDTTDSAGQFAMDVPADPDADPPPMLLARYHGIDYPGDPAGDTVDIPVFETTDSDTAISLASHHIIIDAQDRTVTYILIAHNRGNRTYLTGGDHGHGLEMPLPNGVTDLIRAPRGVHLHGSLLVDPRPIIPGNSQTFFTFALPASKRIAQHIAYPTAAMDLLVQPTDTPVVTQALQDRGIVTLSDNAFQRFGAEQLARGTHVDIQLSSPGVASHAPTWIWIVGASVVVVAILAIYFFRSPRAPPNPRAVLLEQIADLDRRFENGDLAETEYKTRRRALKAEVIDLSTDRNALLEQIADLDEQFENGDLTETEYKIQRQRLKSRVTTLTQQERTQ